MERYIKICILLFLLFSLSFCIDNAEQVVHENEVLSPFEKTLVGTYRYGSITVNGDGPTYMAEFNMEPLFILTSLRQQLERRHIQYDINRNYQLQWTDRGEYQLGMEGADNWQPNFGYWHISQRGDSLIHNAGQPYETKYRLYTVNDGFVRVHSRYMSESGPSWAAGDEVEFAEHFIRIKQ